MVKAAASESVSAAEILRLAPPHARAEIVLAHGAGAPMTSPFMERIAALLADCAITTDRFEFAYMAARRKGERKPPSRAEALKGEYERAVAQVASALGKDELLLIGGKSLGGRVASMVADKLHDAGAVSGLVCLGYPFHPPGKPDELRTAHLAELKCPALIVQGERDPFGTREEVAGYKLSPAIRFHWAKDGDPEMHPRPTSGATHDGNLAAAAEAIAEFAAGLANVRARRGPRPR